ncbi:structure-specific endonuclease subunit SLX4 isoform X2 [Scomber scombrus]|uniref:structure-specific endonuclease subunit SLX4 isoform X2 n=1 Tax=Scomber scombrus TaxID=13677 RepID=UPI002DDA6107|nr:structure-specific endonuclease subunit SLX4 isoform X2 [Scomber scombrus]
MNDSDQDFVDLSSKPLKRVCKPRKPRQAAHPPSSQAGNGDKRRINNRRDGGSGSKCVAAVGGTQPVCIEAEQLVVSGGVGLDSGDTGSSVSVHSFASAAAEPRAERDLCTKDKVLNRMQQFRRASPQRLLHNNQSLPTGQENDRNTAPPLAERRDTPESTSSGLHLNPPDSDEALALRLQQELDREAAEAQSVDLEDGGLFFCQICQRDLTHMTPEGRAQHLNRCLDESETPIPAPPPPPGVPDCPICGKKFKSQKSRSSHLKRCSSDMGVSPAVLLQAVQRQTEESQSTATANTLAQTGGTKRKGPPKPGLPVRKKPRKKTQPLDEDTMVALALSSSLLEQERESQTETAASDASVMPVLKWRPDTGKGHGKRKKGAIPRPPPLLLVQEAEAALTRLQERVSALLLRSRAPSPPTPTRCPSSLPGWNGAVPLWQKSALLDQGSTSLSDFYAPELREFITPWESATTDVASFSTNNKPDTSLRPVAEGTPVTKTQPSVTPSSSQTASSSPAPSTPGTGQLAVGSQVLRDLMELAEDGMTLTQCGYTAPGPAKDQRLSANLHLSGFVLDEAEEHADLYVSGFLPETSHANAQDTHRQAKRTTDQPAGDKERGSHQSVALSRLASELSSMVNNPQLSDVQLQVDSGEVYFAHSFMVYARCPLLAEMVHESGFGVQEEGMPAAQRVLMSDVPGEALLALLQYLYTAQFSIPASLQPHVLELASRFDLLELQQLCELHLAEADYTSQEDHLNDHTDLAFMELLRSMWNEEDDDDNGEQTDADGGRDEERGLEQCQDADVASGDRELQEEQVNEEEMEEIYEFAATQRKRVEEDDSVEEKVDEEEDGEVFTKLPEPKRCSRGFSEKSLQPNSSLDRSYNRLFSDSWGVYREEEEEPSTLHSISPPPKTHILQYKQNQSLHKPSSELSGRTLLQSSVSVVDDHSLSPRPSTSNLPVPGLSPGIVADWDGGGDTVELKERLKRESRGPRSICIPLSPDSPQKKKKPELVVLSDSSEEMEVDVAVLSSRSPSPPSPCTVQTLQSYTKLIPKLNEPSSLDFSHNGPSSVTGSSRPGSGGDQSPVDCSPEVSWLIPSTPVQPQRTNTSSSTQTKSSMCRTQLFPKPSSPSSTVFSSPALPFNNRPQTSNNPTRDSAHISPTDGSVSRLKQDRTVACSYSLDLNFCPKRTSSRIMTEDREVESPVLKERQLSHLSSSTHPYVLEPPSRQNISLNLQLHPHSSTPLHTDLRQPPVLLADSPLHTEPDKRRLTSQERDRVPSESPEKTELGSFHLSPLSDPSGPPSSSSHKSFQSSQRRSKSSSQSLRSVESSNHYGTGSEPRSGIRNKDRGKERDCESKGTDDEGEQEEAKGKSGEAEAADSIFQQSFMDEPPIPFNDSWGFDACNDLGGNPGCFSLRLEDSEASSLQGHSSENNKSGHHVHLLNNQNGVTASAPSKSLSSQTSTSQQAHRGPSFTPSPPNPTTLTTPDKINSLLDSKIWDSWEEEEEEEILPLSQRMNPLKTPALSHNKKRHSLVPITPMPQYSDMDTPELKNKLNRFGVRPLPKRKMILKLKEIHQYTHQLVNSDSEDETPPVGGTARILKPPPTSSAAAGSRPVSCAQTVKFKEPVAISPVKLSREEEAEPLSASQGSNTSSTAASEESERSNPEICLSSDSDSDGGISASQTATRLQDRLRAVRSFILSDSGLYSQILQYQPLVLSQLQQRLKAAGIRLGAAKLVDYLDSQCITFTTAKPGNSAPSRRRGKKTSKGAKGASRKRDVNAVL